MSDSQLAEDGQTDQDLQPQRREPPPSSSPPPPPLPSGRGFRRGERVFERIASFAEQVLGTVTYIVDAVWHIVSAVLLSVLKSLGVLLLWMLDVPAQVLHLYTWKDHLRSHSARTTIMFWGWLIFVIAIWDTFVWSKTFAYVFTDTRDVTIAAVTMGVLTLLIERGFAVMASDKPMVASKKWLVRLTQGYFIVSVLRIGILLILSTANGEAMRIYLSRSEIENVIDRHEAEINAQLHDRRANEIQAEMTRRRNEAEAQAQRDLNVLTQRRRDERERTAQDRRTSAEQQRADIRAQDDEAHQEMHGRWSGRNGPGSNVIDIRARQAAAAAAATAYETETAAILAAHNRETSDAQTRLSDQLRERNVELNAEQDRRIEALRRMTLAELSAQYGIHTQRARGLWARRDALREVHQMSPSSKAGDWFAIVVLVGIGMLVLIAKKTAPHDACVYYCIQAHAFADDDSEMNLLAKQMYAAMLRSDSGVQQLQQDYLTLRTTLQKCAQEYLNELQRLATALDETKMPHSLPKLESLARKAWFEGKDSLGDTLTKVLAMEHTAALARIPLPAHPGSEAARTMSPEITRAELELMGWKDPSFEIHHREQLVNDHEECQENLVQALDDFRKRFGFNISREDAADANRMYHQDLRPAVRALVRCTQRFVGLGVTPPMWIYERNPLTDVDAILARLHALSNAPTSPPSSPTPPRSEELDTDGVRSTSTHPHLHAVKGA